MKEGFERLKNKEIEGIVVFCQKEKNGVWFRVENDTSTYFITGFNDKYNSDNRYLLNNLKKGSFIEKKSNHKVIIHNKNGRFIYEI